MLKTYIQKKLLNNYQKIKIQKHKLTEEIRIF